MKFQPLTLLLPPSGCSTLLNALSPLLEALRSQLNTRTTVVTDGVVALPSADSVNAQCQGLFIASATEYALLRGAADWGMTQIVEPTCSNTSICAMKLMVAAEGIRHELSALLRHETDLRNIAACDRQSAPYTGGATGEDERFASLLTHVAVLRDELKKFAACFAAVTDPYKDDDLMLNGQFVVGAVRELDFNLRNCAIADRFVPIERLPLILADLAFQLEVLG